MKRTKVEIDPAIHAKAKVRAKACRMTLKGWLERLIEAELKREPK
jgi:predicted HicB family RNase H-like nuclease